MRFDAAFPKMLEPVKCCACHPKVVALQLDPWIVTEAESPDVDQHETRRAPSEDVAHQHCLLPLGLDFWVLDNWDCRFRTRKVEEKNQTNKQNLHVG